MRLVRQNIFETNSSSTHSLIMCMSDDIIKWKNKEKYFVRNLDKLVDGKELHDYCAKEIIYDRSKFEDTEENGRFYIYKGIKYSNIKDAYTEENLAEITQQDVDDWINSDEVDSYYKPLTYDEYWQSVEEDNYYGFEENMTTPNGEIVTAFGYYGNDY